MKKIIWIITLCMLVHSAWAQNFEDSRAFDIGGNVTCIKYNTDGSLLACGNSKGLITVRNAKLNVVNAFKGHTSDITHFSFHPSGEYLVSSSLDGSIKVWSLSKNEKVFDSHTIANGAIKVDFFSFAFFDQDGFEVRSVEA